MFFAALSHSFYKLISTGAGVAPNHQYQLERNNVIDQFPVKTFGKTNGPHYLAQIFESVFQKPGASGVNVQRPVQHGSELVERDKLSRRCSNAGRSSRPAFHENSQRGCVAQRCRVFARWLGKSFGPVLAAGIFFSAQAQAGIPSCQERAQMVADLSEHLQETRVMTLMNNWGVLEIFTSVHGTWTAVQTAPNGQSCIRSAGQWWWEFKPGEKL